MIKGERKREKKNWERSDKALNQVSKAKTVASLVSKNKCWQSFSAEEKIALSTFLKKAIVVEHEIVLGIMKSCLRKKQQRDNKLTTFEAWCKSHMERGYFILIFLPLPSHLKRCSIAMKNLGQKMPQFCSKRMLYVHNQGGKYWS